MATETQAEAHAEMAKPMIKRMKEDIEHLKNKAKEEKAAGFDDEAEKTLMQLANVQKMLARIYETNPHLPKEPGVNISPTEHFPVSRSTAARLASRAIVLSALIIAGAGLLCVVMVTGANWYYAEMPFALAAYLIWQHYL
jgi:hypothetical protein